VLPTWVHFDEALESGLCRSPAVDCREKPGEHDSEECRQRRVEDHVEYTDLGCSATTGDNSRNAWQNLECSPRFFEAQGGGCMRGPLLPSVSPTLSPFLPLPFIPFPFLSFPFLLEVGLGPL